MRDKAFIDTNIFIYLQSTSEDDKRLASKRAINSFRCVCSTQVLSETSNVLSKKAKMSFDQVAEIIDGMVQTCELIVVSYETIQKAIEIARDNMLGYYDSLIIASAIEAGCKYLLSEDLTDGQKIYNKITIINIYKHPEML